MGILEIKNIKKSFGEKLVLDGVSLDIKENTIYGFVGRNGAGKTTTMKMILGLETCDEGEIIVCGEIVRFGDNSTNKYIGYLPDVPEFYNYMNAREYLDFIGELAGLKREDIKKRTSELLKKVGLSEEKKRIKGYSRGMKQRLGIAAALYLKPRILICDEPTSALDPIGRREILEILKEIKKETTIIFSTHVLSDVEKICDELALLDGGKIVLSGKISDIKENNRKDRYIIITDENLQEDFPYLILNDKKEYILEDVKELKNILDYMGSHDIRPIKIEKVEPSIEDLVVEVIGQ